MSSFMDKVQAVENKGQAIYNESEGFELQISDPSVIARQDEWQKLTKEHASLMPIVETFRKYKDITSTIDGDKEIIDDPDSDDDLIAMAKEEMNGLTKEQAIWKTSCTSSCCPRTRGMTRTSSWKSAPEPAATKQPSLPATCSACT